MIICLLLLNSIALAGRLELKNDWLFRLDPKNEGVEHRWFADEKEEEWQPIQVECSWESQGYPYDGYAWYRTQFQLPTSASSERILIAFDAVDEEAKIWLNGKFIRAVATGWNVPFEVDVTAAIRHALPNYLVVQVRDTSNQGGIWRPVTVMFQDKKGETQTPEVVLRLQKESVRAITSAIPNDFVAKRMLNAGLNTCMPWSYILSAATDRARKVSDGQDFVAESDIAARLEGIKQEAQLAQKYGIVYMPLIWFNTDTVPFLTKNDYRRAVSVDGRQTNITPCPLDEGYWDYLMLPLLKMLAKIENEVGCSGGASLDVEFYAGDFSGGFTYNKTAIQGCYCDHCFGLFLDSRGENISPAKVAFPQRAPYIRMHYSISDYLDFLESILTVKTRSIAQQVRQIKPDFLMGVLPGMRNWYLRGIAKGLSSPGLPVLIFSEAEYSDGFNSETSEQLAWLEKEGVDALLLGGLTLNRFSGIGIGTKAAELAQKADGYWLYYGQELHNPDIKIVAARGRYNQHAVIEPADHYWNAITCANAWLDKAIVLPNALPHGQMPLFTDILLKKLPEGVSLNATGIAIEPAGTLRGLIINGDFQKPFDSGWQTFDQPPQIVDAPQRHGRALLFDFGTRVGDQGLTSFFQTISVEPDSHYHFSMDARSQGVESPRVGFQLFPHDNPGILLERTTTLSDTDWSTLQGSVYTGKHSKLTLLILANGTAGKIWADNISSSMLNHIRIETDTIVLSSGRASYELVLPKLPSTVNNAVWEIMDPITGLPYFREFTDKTDLRYLHAIFPKVPIAVAVELNVEQSDFLTQIESPYLFWNEMVAVPR